MDILLIVIGYIVMAFLVGPLVMIFDDDKITINKNLTLNQFSKEGRGGGLLCGVLWPIVLPALITMGLFKAVAPASKFVINKILKMYGWIYAELTEPRQNV